MAQKRANLFVYGNVQMAGFRTFVKNLADSFEIKGYAENLPDGSVKIVCEGEEERIKGLIDSLKTKAPVFAQVEDVKANYQEYAGEFLDFERKGEDVPERATLDDLVKVMTSFDSKAEKMVGILGGIKEDTNQIRQDTNQIRQDTNQIRQDTNQIRQDTNQIPDIVENTGKILEHTSHIPEIVENTSLIPAMREDTAAIRGDTREIATKLWEKYEELSREIAQMKVTLAKIEARVFA